MMKKITKCFWKARNLWPSFSISGNFSEDSRKTWETLIFLLFSRLFDENGWKYQWCLEDTLCENLEISSFLFSLFRKGGGVNFIDSLRGLQWVSYCWTIWSPLDQVPGIEGKENLKIQKKSDRQSVKPPPIKNPPPRKKKLNSSQYLKISYFYLCKKINLNKKKIKK